MNDLSAFVLAGGQSSRMGRDKALLVLEGQTLLNRAIDLARLLTPRVSILGPRARYDVSEIAVVEDRFPGCGPLAGIHAALAVTETDWNLIVPIDMPLLNVSFLRYLVERAKANPSSIVTVPNVSGKPQGTCLVCRKEFGATVEQQLLRGKYKLTDSLAIASTQIVPECELREAGFHPMIFTNTNTPQEFTFCKKLLARPGESIHHRSRVFSSNSEQRT